MPLTGLAIVLGVPAVMAIVAWWFKPEWRGRRLFGRWLVVTIAVFVVFALVEVFVHPSH